MTDVAIRDWAGRIRPHLISAAEGIIAAGKELLAAKEALPHGQFGPLLDELGLSARTAQRFMAIARHPVLSNPTHVSHLPGAWGTLYELSRLPGDVVESALESGAISPATRREEAQALLPEADSRLMALTNAIAEADRALTVLVEHPETIAAERAEALFRELRDIGLSAEAAARGLLAEYDTRS